MYDILAQLFVFGVAAGYLVLLLALGVYWLRTSRRPRRSVTPPKPPAVGETPAPPR